MRLTQAAISKLSCPEGKSEIVYFDQQLPGFGLRIRKSGVRRRVLQYDHDGRTRRITIGSLALLTAEQARQIAQQHLAEIRLQKLPQVQRLEQEITRLKGIVTAATVQPKAVRP